MPSPIICEPSPASGFGIARKEDRTMPYIRGNVPFTASYWGRCAHCRKRIKTGQWIQVAGRTGGYHHLQCDRPDSPWVDPDAPLVKAHAELMTPGTIMCGCEHPKASHEGAEACRDCSCVWFHSG
jgi:hypothetical protein